MTGHNNPNRIPVPGPSTTMMGRHPDGTPITFDNPRITQGPARIDDTPIRYPNKGFWDQVVPMEDGGSIQRLPLDPPSSNRRKGFPTGIKPSDMSWEDWYGQWGMKPLPGRISRDESPWGSNWEGSIKYL